jgi:peptidyl-prolyl cis-trans isomerase D
MAVLERIRTKMGIMVSIIIGLSLLAFVLGDFIGRGKSVLGNDQYEIAKISGQTVNIQEYESHIEKLSDVYKFNTGKGNLSDETVQSIRDQSWQQLIEDNVFGAEYKSLGLNVCPKELLDMVQGANPHPYIRQIFTNPETQVFNRSAVMQFIKSLDKETDPLKKNYWLFIESQITRERYMTKYYNLIKKGLYVTSDQINNDIKDNSKKVSFHFVAQKFSSISDSTIQVKESELKKYLKLHSKEFEQEASRDIEYITYDIVPSPEDFQSTQNWIEGVKEEFRTTQEIKQFINLNSDISFNEKYLKQNELPDTIQKLYNGKIGESIGPYFENSTFKLARLIDIKNLSDSVKASHILIKPEAQTKESLAKAKATADSLMNVIKKGGDFASLAKIYSTDGSAKNGGDLGWFKEGQMVKPFNDACFNGKKGDVTVVESQFGVHVILITDKGKEIKKVQVGIMERKVEASSATQQIIYQKASAFAGTNNTGEKFTASLKKDRIVPQTANYLNENMKEIPGIKGSRELVRWAFKSEPNSISGVMEISNKFIIARLTQIREKGIASVEQVKDQLIASVKKDKKAEQILEKMKKDISASSNISDLATKLNTHVESANDITFASYALPSAGFEPNIIAAATSIAPNKLSAPVKGNNGVYVLEVISETTQEGNKEITTNRMAGMYQNRVSYEALNTLKKLAEIKDERAKFY